MSKNKSKTLKLRIGPNDYRVKQVENLKDGSQELWGLVVYSDLSIKLDKNMAASRKRNVLIHECMHAVFHDAGYNETSDGPHTEEVINDISNIVHGFLRDNIETLYELYKDDKF